MSILSSLLRMIEQLKTQTKNLYKRNDAKLKRLITQCKENDDLLLDLYSIKKSNSKLYRNYMVCLIKNENLIKKYSKTENTEALYRLMVNLVSNRYCKKLSDVQSDFDNILELLIPYDDEHTYEIIR